MLQFHAKNRLDVTKPKRAPRAFTLTGAAIALSAVVGLGVLQAAVSDYADPAEPASPPSTMVLDPSRAALVVVATQIDFLSPDGVTWGVLGQSVTEHPPRGCSAARNAESAPFDRIAILLTRPGALSAAPPLTIRNELNGMDQGEAQVNRHCVSRRSQKAQR